MQSGVQTDTDFAQLGGFLESRRGFSEDFVDELVMFHKAPH